MMDEPRSVKKRRSRWEEDKPSGDENDEMKEAEESGKIIFDHEEQFCISDLQEGKLSRGPICDTDISEEHLFLTDISQHVKKEEIVKEILNSRDGMIKKIKDLEELGLVPGNNDLLKKISPRDCRETLRERPHTLSQAYEEIFSNYPGLEINEFYRFDMELIFGKPLGLFRPQISMEGLTIENNTGHDILKKKMKFKG